MTQVGSPRERIEPGVVGSAQAFDFEGTGASAARIDVPGVLCIHGFTGSPYEVRFLGERLAARGFHAVGPALAGHEHGRPDELDGTTWRDWVASAERAFDDLRARHARVCVVGLSMGGLVALHLARHRGTEMEAFCALATPLWLPRHIEVAARGIDRLPWAAAARLGLRRPHVPKIDGQSDIRDPIARRQNPTMPGIPLGALGSLIEFMAVVRGEVAGIRVPAFIAHARRDHTAPFACAAWLQANIGSREVRGLTLGRSYHVITIDDERELVARAVGDFFSERLSAVMTVPAA
jgi:carboxylesterase